MVVTKQLFSLLLGITLVISCTATPRSVATLPETDLNIAQSTDLHESQLTAPPKGFTIPPRGLTAPPKGFTIPPRSVSAPPKGFTLIEGKVTFPASTNKNLFSIPPRGLTAPPKGFTVPPLGFTVPPLGITIPPRGFETQTLETSDGFNLAYAINGTIIPPGRILTQTISQTKNGDLEVSFLTNALPQQDHIIFSAASPSGLVVMGQYLENYSSANLNLNLEETALTLLKNTSKNAKTPLKLLKQSPQLPLVINALHQAIQEDTLSSSMLDTPAVQNAILESSQPITPTLQSIALQPSRVTLKQVGESQILQALAIDSEGKNQTTLSYQWTSSHPEVVSVTDQGIVTAKSVGSATIKASSETVEGIAFITVQEKAIDKPIITSISPTIGKIGDLITIKGDGFATNPLKNTIKFGNQALEVVANSSREIVLSVPDNLVPGTTSLSVENQSGASGNQNFTVIKSPAINSASPAFGQAGSSVILTGSFSPTILDNIVKFNGLQATVTQATLSQLTVTVPSGVTTGPISLTLFNETTTGPIFSPMPSGLSHYWAAENNAQDQAGSNHGTEQGSTYTAGSSGQGFNFDGVNDYVDVGNFDLDTTHNAMTIAFWFKAGAGVAGTDARMISKSTGTAITDHYFMVSNHTISGNERLRFRLKTSIGDTSTLIASSGNISPNTWIFATATFDGSNMTLYQDATNVGSLSKSGTISTNPTIPVWIGNNPTNPITVPWDGVIDEVQIYNRALSPVEIQSLYNTTKP